MRGQEATDNFLLEHGDLLLSFDKTEVSTVLEAWCRTEGSKRISADADMDEGDLQLLLEFGFVQLYKRGVIKPVPGRPISTAGQRDLNCLTSMFTARSKSATEVASAAIDPLDAAVEAHNTLSAAALQQKYRSDPEFARLYDRAFEIGKIPSYLTFHE